MSVFIDSMEICDETGPPGSELRVMKKASLLELVGNLIAVSQFYTTHWLFIICVTYFYSIPFLQLQ